MSKALNEVERSLNEIYEHWETGVAVDKKSEFSAMFRMGFPEEFINSDKPLMMYIGQECLRCNPEKSQAWVRLYQKVQHTERKIEDDWFCERVNHSPFWNFYRRLSSFGYNVVWNNLDKFHPKDKQRLSKSVAVKFNSPYHQGEGTFSVLQREIMLLCPKVIILAIGKGKYAASLASAFSVDVCTLRRFEPTQEEPIHEISNILALNDCRVFWTYHPSFLQRRGKYHEVLSWIARSLDVI